MSTKAFNACFSSLLICLSAEAIGGSNTAELNCKGSREKQPIILAGRVPASEADFDLNLSFKGQSINIQPQNDRLSEVTDFRERVFFLSGTLASGEELAVYALPKSISYKGSLTSGNLTAKFSAVLYRAPLPFGPALQGAWLSCSYRYSI